MVTSREALTRSEEIYIYLISFNKIMQQKVTCADGIHTSVGFIAEI